jgi:hypothetical protein
MEEGKKTHLGVVIPIHHPVIPFHLGGLGNHVVMIEHHALG